MEDSYISDLIDDAADSSEGNKNFSKELYKHWFKTKDRGGFLSISPWLEANKLTIDIGEIVGGKVTNTKVYANMMELYAYVRAVSEGKGVEKYPGGTTSNTNPETYSSFGGSIKGGNPVSRILKIEYWNQGKDTSSFAWKTGHFKGRKTDSGAILPVDMGSPISANLIKIPRIEMDKIYHLLHFTIQSYATTRMQRGEDWWDWT